MLDILRKRRSIRKFHPQKIKEKDLEILKESLLRSPTSRNKMPWTFVIVDDRDLIKRLSTTKKHGSEFLATAPLAVVIAGDETVTDVWIEDCSIASIVLQLTGESLNIGSCWVQVRNRQHNSEKTAEQYVQNLLDLPHHLRVESIIGLGYPDEEKAPVNLSDFPVDKIKHNQY